MPRLPAGHFHHHRQDPKVPWATAAEPLVLHHIQRELVADWQPACDPGHGAMADRAKPKHQGGCVPHGHQGHTFPGTLWPHVTGAGVTQASIKLLLAPARWLQSQGKVDRSCPRGWGGLREPLGVPGALLHTVTQGHTAHVKKNNKVFYCFSMNLP